jgi:hypothetical protein
MATDGPHCRADYTKDNAAVAVVDQSGAVRFLAASLLHSTSLTLARTPPQTTDAQPHGEKKEGLGAKIANKLHHLGEKHDE